MSQHRRTYSCPAENCEFWTSHEWALQEHQTEWNHWYKKKMPGMPEKKGGL